MYLQTGSAMNYDHSFSVCPLKLKNITPDERFENTTNIGMFIGIESIVAVVISGLLALFLFFWLFAFAPFFYFLFGLPLMCMALTVSKLLLFKTFCSIERFLPLNGAPCVLCSFLIPHTCYKIFMSVAQSLCTLCFNQICLR